MVAIQNLLLFPQHLIAWETMSDNAEPNRFVLRRLVPPTEHDKSLWALKSNVYWMRALAILVADNGFSQLELDATYSSVARRKPDRGAASNDAVDNKALEALLMALHYQAGLREFAEHSDLDPFVVSRSAIVSWYYVIYEASIAMVNAHAEENIQKHSQLIRAWHSNILKRSPSQAVWPFSPHLDTLVKIDTDRALQKYRCGNSFALTKLATDVDEARGAIIAYLSGTATRDRKKVEERLKTEHGFRDFRSGDARRVRDKALKRKKVNFVDQAFRYRGKANYRDSVYLSYGADEVHLVANQSDLDTMRVYIQDLETVGAAYLRMASTYVGRRVVAKSWDDFMGDLEENSRLGTPWL